VEVESFPFKSGYAIVFVDIWGKINTIGATFHFVATNLGKRRTV
jgi:hypothetical protein